MYEKKRSLLPLLLTFVAIPVILIIVNGLDLFVPTGFHIDSSYILNLRLTRMLAEFSLLGKILAVTGGIITVIYIIFASHGENEKASGRVNVLISVFVVISLIFYILIPTRIFIFKPEISKVTIESKAGADSFKFLVALDSKNIEHTPAHISASAFNPDEFLTLALEPVYEDSTLYAVFDGGKRGLICVKTYYMADIGDELYAIDIGVTTYCFNPQYYTIDSSLLS